MQSQLPAGVRKAFSKTLGREIWIVNVQKTILSRKIECIERDDFVLTESDLAVLASTPESLRPPIAAAKTVFPDCDLISTGPCSDPTILRGLDAKLPEKQEFFEGLTTAQTVPIKATKARAGRKQRVN